MDSEAQQCTIQYRGYADGDETKILELFNFVFKRDFSLDDWYWAYNENPVCRKDIILALCKERLVGQAASVPLTYLCNGTEVKATRTQNVMVHPEFQGRGIFTEALRQLTEHYRREHVDLVVTFPNNNSLPTFIRKLDYHHIADIYTYQLRNEKLASGNFSNLTFTISAPDSFRGDDVAFLQRCLSRYQFANSRNLEYLKWRYNVRSNKKYHVLRAFLNGNLTALLVFKYYKEASGVDIVEFCADLDESRLSALLEQIQIFYKRENLPVTSYSIWLFPHFMGFDSFISAGFEKTGFSTHVVTKSFSSVTDDGSQCYTSFYLSMGDSDVY